MSDLGEVGSLKCFQIQSARMGWSSAAAGAEGLKRFDLEEAGMWEHFQTDMLRDCMPVAGFGSAELDSEVVGRSACCQLGTD